MKIRNGFVSNSSSSSFIVSLPKEKLPISKIEEYLGGYNDLLTQKEKDALTIAVWNSQYFKDNDSYFSERPEIESDTETITYCCTKWDSVDRNNPCPEKEGYVLDFEEHVPEKCTGCKYLKTETRKTRADDYYNLRDTFSDSYCEDTFKFIEENKQNSLYWFSIDDNEPPKFMDFDSAYRLSNAGNLFKDHTKVIEINEH